MKRDLVSKQICLIIDSTGNLKIHFKPIHECITRILQYALFTSLTLQSNLSSSTTGHQSVYDVQHISDTFSEYGMVLFKDYPPHSEYLVKVFPFSTSLNEFSNFLSNIDFKGGGSCSTAVTEGLAAAYTVCSWFESKLTVQKGNEMDR